MSSDISIQPLSSDFPPLQESIAYGGAPDATFRPLVFDPSDTSDPLDMLSPLLINTSLLIESPAPSIFHEQSTSPRSVISSPSSEPDEIIYHNPSPTSFPFTRRDDHHNGNRYTNNDTIGTSLHERFEDVMNMVRQLPSGEQPKNSLFTPFFTRNSDLYVCLLCPTSATKTISNRTQIIQHITG